LDEVSLAYAVTIHKSQGSEFPVVVIPVAMQLSHAVFDILNLPFGDYAVDPTLKFAAKDDTKQVLRDLLAYRLYRDLRRGWRINLPNLEQVGLLRLEYKSLADLCAAEEEWTAKHLLLVSGFASDRTKWCRTLLDVLRRELAIKVDYLRSDYQDQLKQRSSQRLKEPWSIDEDEQMDRATLAYPRLPEHLWLSHAKIQPGGCWRDQEPSSHPHYGILKRRVEPVLPTNRFWSDALGLSGNGRKSRWPALNTASPPIG
jgi:hypothetical protein